MGPCKPSCEGMERLGAFKAFNLRATNNGLIEISNMNVHDSLANIEIIVYIIIAIAFRIVRPRLFSVCTKNAKAGCKKVTGKDKKHMTSIYPKIFIVSNNFRSKNINILKGILLESIQGKLFIT